LKIETSNLAGETLDWGLLPYDVAWQRQEQRLTARQQGTVTDALIFVEHPSVFTLGVRRGAGEHLVWSEERLRQLGIDLVQTNRGGDITYHGPGQIVGYPIVDLKHWRDLHGYLRLIEQTLINSVGCLGLAATRRPGKTGIWLGERKIAAIGVAVKKWVTCHGFALNLNNDLEPFSGIVPCGITDGSVTSVRQELGITVDPDEAKSILAVEFWKLFAETFKQ
jgi:lipoyl(octanoyl) transferase